MGNSSKFHRGCVNVLSRSWFSSILSFVNDDIAIIFEQRHLKSSVPPLGHHPKAADSCIWDAFKFIAYEVMSMSVIAPHSLNFKLDVVLLLVQITVFTNALNFFFLNDVPSVFSPIFFYVFFSPWLPRGHQLCGPHAFLPVSALLSDHM